MELNYRRFSWFWFIFWSIILFPLGMIMYPVYYTARKVEEIRGWK